MIVLDRIWTIIATIVLVILSIFILMLLGQTEFMNIMVLMLGLNTTFLSVFLELLFNQQLSILVNPQITVMWAYMLYYYVGNTSLLMSLSFKLNELLCGQAWWFNSFWNIWTYSYAFYQWVISSF